MHTRRKIMRGGTGFLLLTPIKAIANSRTPQQLPQEAEQRLEDHAATPLGPANVEAKWAYIMDHNTGAELLDKNASEHGTWVDPECLSRSTVTSLWRR